jgi:hypothetical protein
MSEANIDTLCIMIGTQAAEPDTASCTVVYLRKNNGKFVSSKLSLLANSSTSMLGPMPTTIVRAGSNAHPSNVTKSDPRSPPTANLYPAVSSTSASSLAALLTESYQEIDFLRREISIFRARAGKAECLTSSLRALSTAISSDGRSSADIHRTPLPESAVVILMEFEDRAVRAEAERDRAEARYRTLVDTWTTLKSYLAAVSDAAADHR